MVGLSCRRVIFLICGTTHFFNVPIDWMQNRKFLETQELFYPAIQSKRLENFSYNE